jgi:type III pantothenate kinase
MALIIDAGNSRLKICSWEGSWQVEGLLSGDECLDQKIMPPLADLVSVDRPHGKKETDEVSIALRTFFSKRTSNKSEEVAMVSTVPAMVDLILEIHPGTKIVDHKITFPFDDTLLNPEEVGPDRFCNIATAVYSGLTSALIVDAGTATTFDLLLDGVFRGGLIAPGMAFSANMLGREASRLNPVPFAPCPLKVGINTTSAMAAGSFHVGIQGVQGVIAGLMQEYGQIPVVITGGGGCYLSHPGALFDPHWTQRGTAMLAGIHTNF